MYQIVWLSVFVVLVAIELFTAELTTIWFAGGALAAFVLSLFEGVSIWVQLPVFVVVSVLLLVFTRPALIKLVNRHKIKTNVETVPGKHAIVTEEIDNLKAKGAIELDGLVWTARSSSDETISVGEEVVVVKVEGVKAIVEKIK